MAAQSNTCACGDSLSSQLFGVRRLALDGLDKLLCFFYRAFVATEDNPDRPFRTANTTGAAR